MFGIVTLILKKILKNVGIFVCQIMSELCVDGFFTNCLFSLTENSSKFPISFELDSGVWREFYQTVLNIQRSD